LALPRLLSAYQATVWLPGSRLNNHKPELRCPPGRAIPEFVIEPPQDFRVSFCLPEDSL
jgi:hypothetical protein